MDNQNTIIREDKDVLHHFRILANQIMFWKKRYWMRSAAWIRC